MAKHEQIGRRKNEKSLDLKEPFLKCELMGEVLDILEQSRVCVYEQS
jgi:hypothetical protein